MTDIVLNPGVGGSTVATDTISGRNFQFVKLIDGTVGSENKLIIDSAGNMNVAITSSTVLSTALIAGTSYIGTFGLRDAANSNNIVVKGTGATPSSTDNALVVSLSPNSATLAVTQSGTWNIGSVASLPALPTGSNTIGSVNIAGGGNMINVTQFGGANVLTGGITGMLAVGGPTVVNTLSTGNPVYVGGKALLAGSTKAIDGQRTAIATDAVGRVLVTQQDRTLTGSSTVMLSTTTESTLIPNQGDGIFTDITMLSITNGSATAVTVTLKNATSGTTVGTWNLSAGGGFVLPFNVPLAQAVANNNWTLTLSAAVSTVYAFCTYIKSY